MTEIIGKTEDARSKDAYRTLVYYAEFKLAQQVKIETKTSFCCNCACYLDCVVHRYTALA